MGNCLGGHAGEEEALIEKAMDAVQSAASEASPRLTALLRYNAAQAAWPADAVASLMVLAEGTEVDVIGGESAMAAEYGGLEDRPAPAVRQFRNRRQAIDAEIVSAIHDSVGDFL